MPAQTRAHCKALAPDGQAAFRAGWRDSAFIEYYFVSAALRFVCSAVPCCCCASASARRTQGRAALLKAVSEREREREREMLHNCLTDKH